jgi:hypothetical protein
LTSSDDSPLSDEARNLLIDLKREFTTITIRQWGYFFPCLTATWSFIAVTRPGTLGSMKAEYVKGPPSFSGRGAEWFMTNLVDADDYLDLVEPLWWQVAHSITPEIRDREYMRPDEFAELDTALLEDLAALILKKVDGGIRARELVLSTNTAVLIRHRYGETGQRRVISAEMPGSNKLPLVYRAFIRTFCYRMSKK